MEIARDQATGRRLKLEEGGLSLVMVSAQTTAVGASFTVEWEMTGSALQVAADPVPDIGSPEEVDGRG